MFRLLKNKIIKVINLDKIINNNFAIQSLSDIALSSSDLLVDPDSENKTLVSLTTYNKRIKDIHLVIESIGRQSVKANKIILWLDKDEFNTENIPVIIQKQINRGLEVRFCENMKSYKKLIPTIQLYPNYNIITIDDDILYPYYFIELLHRDHMENPDTVICYRAHKITKDNDGKINQYLDWEINTKDTRASDFIFPTGVGGVLYPVDVLKSKVIDYKLASELAPNGDDIWFKAMSVINGKPSKVVSGYYDFDADFIELTFGQDISLSNLNVFDGGNDKQIEGVFNYFNIKL